MYSRKTSPMTPCAQWLDAPAPSADRVLQQAMDQDDVRSGEIFAAGVALDHKAAVVRNELEAERTDRRARVAAAGRRPCHIQQAVGEVEVAGFDELGEQLTVPERRGGGIAENRVAFALHELHGGREPLAGGRGQVMNEGVRVFEFGARKKRCIA